MTSHRQRNDGKSGRKRPRFDPLKPRPNRAPVEPGTELVWGWHAVLAGLKNPRRAKPKRLLATPERAREITARIGEVAALEIAEAAAIAQAAPQGAIHQGVLLKTAPLEPFDLDELGSPAEGLLVMLDQVTDPQNVGAIFRSAAAFGAKGIILQERHAPALGGALAKAAAGAVDVVPHARVVNLSRALETLADLGWRSVGLDGRAETTLAQALDGSPSVLVVGSEGEGLRRLVAEHCDILAKIPMPGGFESLNVAAAAAVALYEGARDK